MAAKSFIFGERENAVLEGLSKRKGMSQTAVLRQALALYQLADNYAAEGKHIRFGDEQVIILGLGDCE